MENFDKFFLAAPVLAFSVYLIYRVYIALNTGVVQVPLRSKLHLGPHEEDGYWVFYRKKNPQLFFLGILAHCLVSSLCFVIFLMIF